MNISNITKAATSSLYKAGFVLKKYSPEIMMVGGTIGVIASAVMACKATTKIDSILETTKENIDTIHIAEASENVRGVEYTKSDAQKDLTITYVKAGVSFIKLYGPAILIGLLSLSSLIGAHTIMKKRNVALAAAYATVDKTLKKYRKNVIERYGKDVDKELRYGIKAQEIVETGVDENGNQTSVTKTINTYTPEYHSDYSRWFDKTCLGYTDNPEYNLMFLRKMQSIANDKLRTKGVLFLNDVYDMFNIPRTQAGSVVGWFYDKNDPTRQNHVDFGLYDEDEAKKRFVNGYTSDFLMEFNVDGYIFDMLPNGINERSLTERWRDCEI